MRIHKVLKARKEIRCSKCGLTIKVGDPYIWWKHRYGSPTKWHSAHGYPPPSVLTTSDKLSRIYEARENIEGVLPGLSKIDTGEDIAVVRESIQGAIDDLISVISEASGTAEEVGDEYEESAQNIEEHFGQTSQVDDITEKADNCRSWAESLQECQSELEEWRDDVDGKELEELTDLIDEIDTRVVDALSDLTI